jgi:hypothetical protein
LEIERQCRIPPYEKRFSEATESKIFNDETLFNYTIFEQPNKAIFDIAKLETLLIGLQLFKEALRIFSLYFHYQPKSKE